MLTQFNWPLIVTLMLVLGAALGVIAYFLRLSIKALKIYINNNAASSDKNVPFSDK